MSLDPNIARASQDSGAHKYARSLVIYVHGAFWNVALLLNGKSLPAGRESSLKL